MRIGYSFLIRIISKAILLFIAQLSALQIRKILIITCDHKQLTAHLCV